MFKEGDKVRFLRAVDKSHVGRTGTITEVSWHEPPMYGVKLDGTEEDPDLPGVKPTNTVGCVQAGHIELVKE